MTDIPPQAPPFDAYFHGQAREFLLRGIEFALVEDGPDLTSQGVFDREELLTARILAKQELVVCGLPLFPLILERAAELFPEAGEFSDCVIDPLVPEASRVPAFTQLARLRGPAALLLKAERVLLNYLTHLSGVATLTARYVAALAGSRTRLLDTRKTLPGLRHAEKYAVRCGGGCNHRMDLAEMLMLKDNHIDRAGSITKAVNALRAAYASCPPIEVECRTLADVDEAVTRQVQRIMLDNMSPEQMAHALTRIPPSIESEISGSVSLDNLAALGRLGADFISVGRITHSAPAADCSMLIALDAVNHDA
jgi:nicotinate-nucleotide pyrophosphorylase (carboxylating)